MAWIAENHTSLISLSLWPITSGSKTSWCRMALCNKSCESNIYDALHAQYRDVTYTIGSFVMWCNVSQSQNIVNVSQSQNGLRMLCLSFSLSLSLSLPFCLYLYLSTSLFISMYVCCNKVIRMQHREWTLCVIVIERKLHCVNFRNITNYAN